MKLSQLTVVASVLLSVWFTGCCELKPDGETNIDKIPPLTKPSWVTVERAGFAVLVPAGWQVIRSDFPRNRAACSPAFMGPDGFLVAELCPSSATSLNAHLQEDLGEWKQKFEESRVRVLQRETFRSRSGVQILAAHVQLGPKSKAFYYFRNKASQVIRLSGFPGTEYRTGYRIIAESIELTGHEDGGQTKPSS